MFLNYRGHQEKSSMSHKELAEHPASTHLLQSPCPACNCLRAGSWWRKVPFRAPDRLLQAIKYWCISTRREGEMSNSHLGTVIHGFRERVNMMRASLHFSTPRG